MEIDSLSPFDGAPSGGGSEHCGVLAPASGRGVGGALRQLRTGSLLNPGGGRLSPGVPFYALSRDRQLSGAREP